MQQLHKPHVKIPLTKFDWLMEFLCFVVLLAIWIYVSFSYRHLPYSIPTHFNMSGTIDGVGNKSTIFILPIVGSCLYLLLTIIGQYPQVHNYLVKVTLENATQLYTTSCRLLRYLKLFMTILFGVILFSTIRTATGSANGLSPFFFPIFIISILLLVLFFIISSYQTKKLHVNN